ncbi:hypothetical protein [Aquabacterium sp.]|uniref:hypothetical protein n=1 Tax=Aquabacterium sp. TaxID=1872578 RepID=UPI0039C88AC7
MRVDAEGLVLDGLPSEVRVVCVTPAHQFPLGYLVPPASALAALVERKRLADGHCDLPGQDTLAASLS